MKNNFWEPRKVENVVKRITFQTEKLAVLLETDPLRFVQIMHREAGDISKPVNAEFFRLQINGAVYEGSSFKVMEVEQREDARNQMLRIHIALPQECLCGTVYFLDDADGSIEFGLQLWNQDGAPSRKARLQLPLLGESKRLGLTDAAFFSPASSFVDAKGKWAMISHPIADNPIAFLKPDGVGIMLQFDQLTDHFESAQNRNLEMRRIMNEHQLDHFEPLLRLNQFPSDVIQMRFRAVTGGWPQIFGLMKEAARAKVDFREYRREDLRWYEEMFLHHFTYVYSREVFDYNTGRLNIEKLLREGEEFGGYDVICLWHQYPRLGVDGRSQWDFFEEFPGGIEGIAEAVQICHAHGTRVMLPYKPWDAPYEMSMKDTADQIAGLIRKTDVDGFFLDTMNNLPAKFRQRVDESAPGIVFCAEGHPGSARDLGQLTSSWEQYFHTNCMPEVPLLRFLIPEHRSPHIPRWFIEDDRDSMIKKAILNGSGLVIWQDIFGSWLPYETRHKEAVRKWKEIWKRNQACFCSQKAVPFWPALQKGLIVNAFPAEDGGSVVFTVYNSSESTVEGDLLEWREKMTAPEDLWNPDRKVWCRNQTVCAELEPLELAVIRIEL